MFIPIIVSAVAAVAADYLWVGTIMKGFYLRSLPSPRLNAEGVFTPNVVSAALVYLIIAAGIALFVLPRSTSVVSAFGWGALFGFVIYGVYDLTNHAILANYPLKLVIIDLAWGTFLCGGLAVLAYLIKA